MSEAFECPQCGFKFEKPNYKNDYAVHFNIKAKVWREQLKAIYHCTECGKHTTVVGDTYPNYFATFKDGSILRYWYGKWDLIDSEQMRKKRGKYIGGFKIIQ